MLRGLIKPDIDAKQPEQRIAALGKLDSSDASAQTSIERLALEDSSLEVRLAAIELVQKPGVLEKLMSEPVPQITSAACARFQAILEDTDSKFRFLESVTDLSVQSRIMVACYALDDTARREAMKSLSTEEQFAQIVYQAKTHAIRMEASILLVTPEILENTIGKIKNRDKLVARQLQQRLAEHRAIDEKNKLHEASVRQIQNAMETLSSAVWSPQFSGQFAALESRWESLAPSPAESQEAIYQSARQTAAARVERYHAQQTHYKHLQQLLQRLQMLHTKLVEGELGQLLEGYHDFHSEKDAVEQDWVAACEQFRQTQSVSADVVVMDQTAHQSNSESALNNEKAYQIVKKDIQRQLDCLSQLNLLESRSGSTSTADSGAEEGRKNELSPEPRKVIEKVLACKEFTVNTRVAAELRQRLQSLGAEQVRLNDEQQAALKAIHKQLGALGAVIGAGKWSTANSMYQRVEKKIQKISGPQRKSLEGKLSTHKKKLTELSDWKDFAAKPKLVELCVAMEALPEKAMKAPELAKAIKALQAQWKAIGSSKVSNEIWPRFKTAGDKAYEPCNLYFDNLTKQREAMHKNRDRVCVRLQEYLDGRNWENADWREVERTLTQAQREWRNNRVVGRKPDKTQENRFRELQSTFDEKLASQYQEGIAERKELIEKMRALSSADINQHTINQAKRLQAAWKQCGIAGRNDDQSLWKEFNELCGGIFTNHREVQRQHYKSSMEHVDRARDIVKAIKQMLSREGEADEQKFSNLQDEFQKLPEFPEKVRKGLIRDFQRACDSFSEARSSLARKSKQMEMEELRRLAGLCEQLEGLYSGSGASQQNGGSADNGQAALVNSSNREEIEALWDSQLVGIPKPWLKKISRRRDTALKSIENNVPLDFEENERVRRLHCIKVEILRDKETPAEDKAVRMQYQLEQLQAGPDASQLQDRKDLLRNMEVEWLCMAPAHPERQSSLDARYYAAHK